MHLVQRNLFVAILALACFSSFGYTSLVVPGSKNVVLLDITLKNGTTIQSIELPSSYCWISKVITDANDEFTADVIALDIATDGCSIANPLDQTENQIGIAYVTRHTVRSVSSNGCSYFQLVAAAQRKNFMAAVIMIRNDSALNNEWEGGYFFEGTTSIIFTEIQAYEAIINRVGGSAQIQRMSARVLAAPDNVILAWEEHVVRYTGQFVVTCLLSGFSFLWAVVLLPFRLKYFPITSKTLLAFLTFLVRNFKILDLISLLQIAAGRLLHLMSKLGDSKTERNNRDRILRKKIAAVMTILGILGLYAVVNNFTTSALSLNADLNLSLVFGLRFAENLAVWVILWFFTDTIVHRADSSTTSVSSSKGKSKAQLSTVNSKTNASVAGQASVAPANNTLSESDD